MRELLRSRDGQIILISKMFIIKDENYKLKIVTNEEDKKVLPKFTVINIKSKNEIIIQLN